MPVYWIWFAQLRGISLRNKRQLLESFADPEEIYLADLKNFPKEMAEALAQKDLTEARKICGQCTDGGIRVLTYAEDAYPERLRNIEDPPMVLYVKGQLPDWQKQPVIAVVGTRKASGYGLQTAHLLGAQIAVCGGLVVSGVATGIDRLSMEGALDGGKPVVGVLGCGVDVVYPAGNRDLYQRIQETGCLLSEFVPGSRPYPGNFLQRNRIISGISDGVLVVEAPERSGALNTAQHGFSQGRDMFAVPGNLGVDTCKGSNGLLQEGAYAVLSGWDVVKHYEPLYPGVVETRLGTLHKQKEAPLPKVAESPVVPAESVQERESPAKIAIDNWDKSTYSVINKKPVGLNDQEAAIFDLLSEKPQYPDSIMDAAELPFGTVQSVLTRLAIKGLVSYESDGRIRRK